MKIDSRQGFTINHSGRVTAFGILILIMFLITIYELSVIYADWNKIRLIGLNIRVLNEQRLPVSDVSLSVNGEFAGFTNMEGKYTALLSKPGDVEIIAKKNPFDEVDTLISLNESGSNLSLTMNRPFATLSIVTLSQSGEPLNDVGVTVNGKNYGSTGSDGSITISESLHLQDTLDIDFKKSGFEELTENIYLSDINHIDSFALVKRTEPARPVPVAPPKPKPDFQGYVNRASNYLDRAISGDTKYFGRALTEIEKAINAKPKSLLAKQLKVEILYNFAKSLRDSNLPYEAVNRLGEALKMYRDIPQDPLYIEVNKLKREIEIELGG